MVIFIYRSDRGPPREREDRWQRGGGMDRRDDAGPPSEKQPWRPAGGGGWREREKEKHDSWKKDPERFVYITRDINS